MTTRVLTCFIVLICSAALIPAAVLAKPKPPRVPSVLPRPRISLMAALTIAQKDEREHGALVSSGGYLSQVEYGRYRKLSSGATCTCASPRTLVWAITYTDVHSHTRAKQIIGATTGKVFTRVYYPPPMP